MELGVEIGKLLVALLVLINPFSALSIYLDLTQDHSTKERRRIARTAALAVFIVIVVFALGGGILLKVLGISVGSFQVGGGILVLLIAISLMNGNDNPAKPKIDTHSEEHQSAQQVRRNEKELCCSWRASTIWMLPVRCGGRCSTLTAMMPPCPQAAGMWPT